MTICRCRASGDRRSRHSSGCERGRCAGRHRRVVGGGEFAPPLGAGSCWAGCAGSARPGRVGVEGTGSYGAGLARVSARLGGGGGRGRPPQPPGPPQDRQVRPGRRGRSGPGGAVGSGVGAAKSRDGNVEAIRALVVAKRGGRNAKIKRSTRSAISVSPPPTSCGNACRACPASIWRRVPPGCGPAPAATR